jgi:hypothetical protein
MAATNKYLAQNNKSLGRLKATKKWIRQGTGSTRGWARVCLIPRGTTMAEQPVNLSIAIYLGVFSRADQRVLQAIFKAIAGGGGRCVATLAMLARDSNTSKPTTRNAIAQAVAIGLLEKTERRSYCAVSLPTI